MLVDLVQVTTSDAHRLHGALELPAAPKSESQSAAGVVDAWLCIHGTGSNFYSASTLGGLAPKLLATGAAVLRANTRGHDLISTGPSAQGRYLQGAAFERVDESPLDIAAWTRLLQERGFRRIGLLGHSLGAVKAIFTLAADNPPAASALVAISPPHLSYSYFRASPRGDEFRQIFAVAEEHVRAGRGDELLHVKFPMNYHVSAAGYVDRYGPEERYDVLKLLDRVRCPTLVTYGSSEVQNEVAFRGMPEAVEKLTTAANSLEVAVIAGADHIYTGCHDVLSGRIASWLGRTKRAGSGVQ
ncbi:MAG: alpha/beta fold hydrolase [Planctomycetia bacterium]|nr:alpha/beta fold hydrolase [Planctomycetia bacterium]